MPYEDIASVADIVRYTASNRPTSPPLWWASGPSLMANSTAARARSPTPFGRPGVDFGDRVAFIDKSGAEFFELTYGLAKLGAVIVPVNWRLAAPEMLQIIEDAGAEVVVVGSEFFGHIEAIEDRLTRSTPSSLSGATAAGSRSRTGSAVSPPMIPASPRRGRRRLPAVHVGHHRPAQGRDAEDSNFFSLTPPWLKSGDSPLTG